MAHGLEHDPDADTRGMLVINRALTLNRRADREGAITILGELALDPRSTLTTAMLAKSTLAQLIR
jgi:hypothetical protein